jgi:hypothetical protein
MKEGFDMDYFVSVKVKEKFETKMQRYKHTMEFIRTVIGVILLIIQVFVLIKLYSNWPLL